MNDQSRTALASSRSQKHRGLLALFAILLCPGIALAELIAIPYGASRYEYDSNVFALSSRDTSLALHDSTRRSDELLRSIAGLETGYQWSQQKLRGQIEGRRLDYDHFQRLDHNEYLYDAGIDWKLFGDADGTVDVRQERRMASFADRNSTELTMERDRLANGTFKVLLTPEWRLDGAARNHKLASPLVGFPDFALDETYGSLGLDYLGVSSLAAGVLVEYGSGRFRGFPDATSYRQTTAEGTVVYTVSGLSSLDAKLGYTRFSGGNSGGGGSVSSFGGGEGNSSGLAGSLGYTRTLSAKSDINLQGFRRVGSFVGGANSVTDTGASATANWRPTLDLALSANYQWLYSRYRAVADLAAVSSDRRDHVQLMSLNINYQVLRWAAIHVFGEYHDRNSNVDFDAYNEALAGLELRLRFE